MITIENYPYREDQVLARIEDLKRAKMSMDEQTAYRFILGCIDLTTLEGSDNNQIVVNLCNKALEFKNDKKNIPAPAAVCIYPTFAAIAKQTLAGSPVHVATVAGAFPAGQSPMEVKLAEIKYALEQGAEEIDMVISRGKFLEGNYQEVYDEIVAIRKLCGNAHLKVILETGELKNVNNIYKASQIAILAGADFIKTSTGKIAVNATPEAFLVMMDAVQRHYETTGKIVGVKAAGGISNPETAMLFVQMLDNVLGKQWLTPKYFRFGASRLASKIFERIQ